MTTRDIIMWAVLVVYISWCIGHILWTRRDFKKWRQRRERIDFIADQLDRTMLKATIARRMDNQEELLTNLDAAEKLLAKFEQELKGRYDRP